MQIKLMSLRKQRNINQEEMAKLLGIHKETYNRKEKGKYNFTSDEMFIIADYFNMKIEDIFLPRIHQNGVERETFIEEHRQQIYEIYEKLYPERVHSDFILEEEGLEELDDIINLLKKKEA